MDAWLSWLVGFVLWLVLLVLLGGITFLVVSGRTSKYRGHFPPGTFDYRYRCDLLPGDGFYLDTHSHTIASDGWMTPEENVQWHVANGFDAMVVTDHNTTDSNAPSLALQDKYPDILIIPGYEWTTPRIHLNFIGLETWPEKVSLARNPSDAEVRRAIAKAKELGAVVQVDHISWTKAQGYHRTGETTHPTREQLVAWGIDGFEINNEMRWYDPRSLHWLDQFRGEHPDHRPLYVATGTDVHNPMKEWATGWTELLLTPAERAGPTIEVVKQALREGRTRIWVDHDYRAPPEAKLMHPRKQTLLAPLYGLAHGIAEIPGSFTGILSWAAWLVLAYFPLRLLFTWMAAW